MLSFFGDVQNMVTHIKIVNSFDFGKLYVLCPPPWPQSARLKKSELRGEVVGTVNFGQKPVIETQAAKSLAKPFTSHYETKNRQT